MLSLKKLKTASFLDKFLDQSVLVSTVLKWSLLYWAYYTDYTEQKIEWG